MNVETLTTEISAESPAGEDLEYDPDFGELERSAQGKAEQVMGDEVVEAEPPDWRSVLQQAEALFDRTLDLRVGVLLARAGLNTGGLAGLADGLHVMRRLLENHWDTVYPVLDADDDNDPTIRVNTVANLADENGLLKDLQLMPIVSARMAGRFSLRDVRIANGDIQAPADEDAVDSTIVNAAFMEADLDEMIEHASRTVEALEHAQAIDAAFNERVGAANGPDLQALFTHLDEINRIYSTNLNARGVGVEADGAEGDEGGESQGSPISGDIRSREDAIRMIEKICLYFERHEPSSPVPLLLNRAKGLISKDFLEILRDLTPDGVSQAETIRGALPDE